MLDCTAYHGVSEHDIISHALGGDFDRVCEDDTLLEVTAGVLMCAGNILADALFNFIRLTLQPPSADTMWVPDDVLLETACRVVGDSVKISFHAKVPRLVFINQTECMAAFVHAFSRYFQKLVWEQLVEFVS